MKLGFYPKLAFEAIRKNKRLYLPYIFTCTGMVMMYYIIASLSCNDTLTYLSGANSLRSILEFGGWTIAIFSVIFLFYTNSFLIRRRKKEFGLYNILGMNKRNIARILLWETVIVALIAFVFGLTAGIALSKLAELGLVNILQEDINYTLNVSVQAIQTALAIFGAVFALLLLNSIRQVKASNAIQLIRSENIGEKPPKANWVFGFLGLAILAGGYFIAVTIENPIDALAWFFVAVIMVIIGTYLVFVCGSVVFCRILQQKKNYYYKPHHFISVSSMVYRMKRNGAGLASICILSTMVLVMISATTSLYFGAEDALRNYYPKEINVNVRMQSPKGMSDENISNIRNVILQTNAAYDAHEQNIVDYRSAVVTGLLENGAVETDVSKVESGITASNVFQIHILPLEDYNRLTHQAETLEQDEALIYTGSADYNESTITFRGGNTFRIKKQLSEFSESEVGAMNALPSLYLIVPDLNVGLEGISELTDYNGNQMVTLEWTYAFDTQLDDPKQAELCQEIDQAITHLAADSQYDIHYSKCSSRQANRADFYNSTGGLFFLGIVLSIVFIFAAVLIIYYKQMAESYEDQARFEIMQKVGLSKKGIRKSVNSQLLTVFFLPLIGAGIHLAFAFPMIRKLLLLFNLNNVGLFALTTVISFFAFSLLYMIIYWVTSNAYYANLLHNNIKV